MTDKQFKARYDLEILSQDEIKRADGIIIIGDEITNLIWDLDSKMDIDKNTIKKINDTRNKVNGFTYFKGFNFNKARNKND